MLIRCCLSTQVRRKSVQVCPTSSMECCKKSVFVSLLQICFFQCLLFPNSIKSFWADFFACAAKNAVNEHFVDTLLGFIALLQKRHTNSTKCFLCDVFAALTTLKRRSKNSLFGWVSSLNIRSAAMRSTHITPMYSAKKSHPISLYLFTQHRVCSRNIAWLILT